MFEAEIKCAPKETRCAFTEFWERAVEIIIKSGGKLEFHLFRLPPY